MDYLSLGLRLFLAFVCLAAVVGKARDRFTLAELGDVLDEVGVPVGRTTAVVLLVLAESAVAVLTPWPATALAGCLLAVALFAVLTTGVALAVRAGAEVPCRCFGGAGAKLNASHVVRNVTLTVAAVAACWSVLVTGGAAGSVIGDVLAGGTAAVAAALVVFWDDLTTLVSDDLMVEVQR
jgi:hypothetical protein